MQHEIFLYLITQKGVTGFNSGSKRFAYILAQFYPTYLRRYRYFNFREVSIDSPGAERVQSIDLTGDVLHDLNLRERIEAERRAIETAKASYIEVTYADGSTQKYDDVEAAAADIGCTIGTIYRWLKKGVKWHDNWDSSNAKFKSLHLKTVKMLWINPFAGSKLAVTKVVTLKAWEDRVDRDDFEPDDENEYYALKKHKESGEGLLVRFPPKKVNPYLQPTA